MMLNNTEISRDFNARAHHSDSFTLARTLRADLKRYFDPSLAVEFEGSFGRESQQY
jgi:hypothetical protein